LKRKQKGGTCKGPLENRCYHGQECSACPQDRKKCFHLTDTDGTDASYCIP